MPQYSGVYVANCNVIVCFNLLPCSLVSCGVFVFMAIAAM